MRNLVRLFALFACVSSPALAWEYWGGDAGGMRFSPLTQITPANVGNLVRAWEFRTGDLDSRAPEIMKRTKFQATPLLVEDSLIFCSPFNEVIALDPGSGVQKWRYDPKISTGQRPANATIAAASPIGSIARPLKAPPAARGSSWAPTTSA
jgi:quinoprotein glucose dehydrogenase